MDAKTNIKRRRKLTSEGTYITRSDIRRAQGQTQGVVALRNIGMNDSTELDGGKAITLAKTPSYGAYVFYLAPKSSIGKNVIETGNKTVVVNTGLLFVTIEKKGPGRGNKYLGEQLRCSAGQVINIKKGQRYTYSTGNSEAELLIIESGDLSEKVLEQPLTNLDGAQQYRVTRNPGIDVAELKPRKRMSKAEREAFGAQYAASRGMLSAKEKAQISKAIARGDREDVAQTVVGVNPTPIGDIGDDYLPTE